MGQARYTVTAESGPDHEKRFSVEVRLEKNGGSRVLGAATAETKKAAQQKAAEAAFTELSAAQEPQPQEEERS